MELVKEKEINARQRYEAEAAISNAKDAEEDARYLAEAQRKSVLAKEQEITTLQSRLRTLLMRTKTSLTEQDIQNLFSLPQPLHQKDENHNEPVPRNPQDIPHRVNETADKPSSATVPYLYEVIDRLQEQIQEARERATTHANELALLRDTMGNKDKEIQRLSSALASAAPNALRANSTSAFAGNQQDQATIAASNARIIAQLNEQIDFLTSELAARDGGINVKGKNPSNALSASVDAASRVAALELEITRLATRLEATKNSKDRAEQEANSLRNEVASLQALVSEAQAAARIAAEDAAEASASNERSANEAANNAVNPNAPKSGYARTRAELASALRELSRLQAEHARLAAGAEAVAVDRERFMNEINRLENALADSNGRINAQAAETARARESERGARSESAELLGRLRAREEDIQSLRREIEDLTNARRNAERQLQHAEAELANIRPLVGRQASDNERLRNDNADLRATLADTQARLTEVCSSRDDLANEVRNQEGVAARTGLTASALEAEVIGLRREIDRLTTALDTARSAEDIARRETARLREAHENDTASLGSLRNELDDVSAKLAAQTRLCAAAQDQVTRLSRTAGLSDEVASLRSEVTMWRTRATNAEIASDAVGRARDRAEAQVSERTQELEAAKAAHERTAGALLAAERRAAELSRELADCEAKLRACETDRDHIRGLLDQAQAQIGRLDGEMADSRVELARAREQMDAARNATTAANQRAQAAEAATLSAKGEAESYARMASEADAKRNEAERARDEMAAQLSSVLRKAEMAVGEAEVARRRAELAAQDTENARTIAAKEAAQAAEAKKKVDQFSALFIQLDRTRESAAEQLNETTTRIVALENKVHELNTTVESQRRTLDSKENEITRLRNALTRLDGEGEALNEQLDSQAEKISELKRNNDSLGRQISVARAEAESLRSESNKLASTLSVRERELAGVRAQLEEQRKLSIEAVAARDTARAEFANAAEDLTTMTRENQRVASELVNARRDVENARNAVDAIRVQLAQAEAAVAQLHAERAEVLTLYQSVCDERAALIMEADNAAALRSTAEAQNAALAAESGNLRAALDAETDLRRHAESTVASLELQLETLSQELQAAKGDLAATSGQARTMERDVNAARSTTENYSGMIAQLHAKLQTAQSETQTALNSASTAIAEKTATLQTLMEYRQRVDDLEGQLAECRAMQAKMTLSEARAREATEDIRLRLIEEQNNVVKLREELTRTRNSMLSSSTSSTGNIPLPNVVGSSEQATAALVSSLANEIEQLKQENFRLMDNINNSGGISRQEYDELASKNRRLEEAYKSKVKELLTLKSKEVNQLAQAQQMQSRLTSVTDNIRSAALETSYPRSSSSLSNLDTSLQSLGRQTPTSALNQTNASTASNASNTSARRY